MKVTNKDFFVKGELTIFGQTVEVLIITTEIGTVCHSYSKSEEFRIKDYDKSKDADKEYAEAWDNITNVLGKDSVNKLTFQINKISRVSVSLPLAFNEKNKDFFNGNDSRKVLYQKNASERAEIVLLSKNFSNGMRDSEAWKKYGLYVKELDDLQENKLIQVNDTSSKPYSAMWEEKHLWQVYVSVIGAHDDVEDKEVINPKYLKLRKKEMLNQYVEWQKAKSSNGVADENKTYEYWLKNIWKEGETDGTEATFIAECKKNGIEEKIHKKSIKKGVFSGTYSDDFNLDEIDIGGKKSLSIAEKRIVEQIYNENSDELKKHPVLALPDDFMTVKDGKETWKYPSIDERVVFALNMFDK